MSKKSKSEFALVCGGLYVSEDECTTVSWKGGVVVPVSAERDESGEDYIMVIGLVEPVDHCVMHHVMQKWIFQRVA